MNGIRGKKILITRAKGSDNSFENALKSFGASVEFLPVIEIMPVNDYSLLDEKISIIDNYDGIFFTSSNAVKYFFERLLSSGKKFSGKIFTVGSKTKTSVESFGYKIYFAPLVYSSEELADSIDKSEIKGKKYLFPCGNLTGNTLNEKLGSLASIDEVVVYQTILPETGSKKVNEIKNKIEKGKIDCISFFSPSSVENFLKLFPGFNQKNIKIAVIGNTTLNRIKNFGLKADIIPEKSTSESLAKAIADYFNKSD
jgi:uroporphyrinogen III methyltransferase/synthase